VTVDDLTAFVMARLDEDNAGRHLNFVSYPALAAAWSDHPDYRAEWAP